MCEERLSLVTEKSWRFELDLPCSAAEAGAEANSGATAEISCLLPPCAGWTQGDVSYTLLPSCGLPRPAQVPAPKSWNFFPTI